MNTLLISLCTFFVLCWCNLVVNTYALTNRHRRSEQDENEERIVVKQLAKMIRNSQENLKSQMQKSDQNGEKTVLQQQSGSESADQPNDNVVVDNAYNRYISVLKDSDDTEEPSYDDYPLNDDSQQHQQSSPNDNKVESNKQPFAVPPSDYRYYEKDFSQSAKPLQVPPSGIQIQNTMDNNVPIAPSLSGAMKKEPLNETEEEIQRRKLYAHLTLNPSFIPYGQVQSLRLPAGGYYYNDKNGTYFLALIYGTVCAILVITTGAAYVFYRKLRKNVKDAEDVDYPAYGVTGPCKDTPAPTGDRHLAHSAQMYHYQHQKQQIIAMEKNSSPMKIRKGTESGSEEDDMTVYECPGLAPVTGEMEVKNPMFQDEDEVKISTTAKESTSQKSQTHLEVRKSSK